MLASNHGNIVQRPRPSEWSLSEWIWYSLTIGFFVFGAVGTLGEYVFHWWHEPFEVWGPAALAVALVGLGWSASSRDLRSFRAEFRAGNGALLTKQDQMLAKQDQTLEKLDELIAGQAEQTAMLRALIQGQAEQTALLREVVASFRAR